MISAAPFTDGHNGLVMAHVLGRRKARTRIVAFDFDKCLMKEHWWGTHQNNPIETINPTAADFACAGLAALVPRLGGPRS